MERIKIITLTEEDLENKVTLQDSLKQIAQLTHYAITNIGSAKAVLYNTIEDIENNQDLSIYQFLTMLDGINEYLWDIKHISRSITSSIQDNRNIQQYELEVDNL